MFEDLDRSQVPICMAILDVRTPMIPPV
jgi:hypothetical protein